MRLPSVKTLTAAFPDLTRTDAELLRAILRGYTRPKHHPDRFPLTIQWARSCYNWPTAREWNMAAANELLGGYGVEAAFDDGAAWPWLEYVNFGEAYAPTLCRVNGRYVVAAWADLVEARC